MTNLTRKPSSIDGGPPILVDETEISNRADGNLIVRGYDLMELADRADVNFEEICLLLVLGEFPKDEELSRFKEAIMIGRGISGEAKDFAKNSTCLTLREFLTASMVMSAVPKGPYLTKLGHMLGFLPSILGVWYASKYGAEVPDGIVGRDISVADHILRLFGPHKRPIHSIVIDRILKIYSEVGLNSSSFSARCAASTEADYTSSVICALETALTAIRNPAETVDIVKNWDLEKVEQLARSGSAIFGRILWKNQDPRCVPMRKLCAKVADESVLKRTIAIEAICAKYDTVMANIQVYAGVTIEACGIPLEIIDFIFTVSRLAGWTAHIKEQAENNRLIRPRSIYYGHDVRHVKTLPRSADVSSKKTDQLSSSEAHPSACA